MKRIACVFILLMTASVARSEDVTDKENRLLFTEGKRLYQSEHTTQQAMELFLQQKQQAADIGGSFAYVDEQRSVGVIYDHQQPPQVIGTFSFDSSYNMQTVQSDLKHRSFNRRERELYSLRQAAMAAVADDTFFRFYQNTVYNYIALAEGTQRNVYIYTSSSLEGIVLFGNDYLLSFDRNNELKSKSRLHQEITAVPYGSPGNTAQQKQGVVHNHSKGSSPLMTPTDVCILLLYEKQANWQQHIIISPQYVSIWNCTTDEVHTVTAEAAAVLLQQGE